MMDPTADKFEDSRPLPPHRMDIIISMDEIDRYCNDDTCFVDHADKETSVVSSACSCGHPFRLVLHIKHGPVPGDKAIFPNVRIISNRYSYIHLN